MLCYRLLYYLIVQFLKMLIIAFIVQTLIVYSLTEVSYSHNLRKNSWGVGKRWIHGENRQQGGAIKSQFLLFVLITLES